MHEWCQIVLHFLSRLFKKIGNSEKELPSVGRSLRMFSLYLLNDEYFESKVVQRKLFKTFDPAEVINIENGESQIINVTDSISDADLIKCLVDFMAIPEGTYSTEKANMRNTVQQMKILAIESGMIKL